MFEPLDLTRMARALAAHAGARMALVAENVANADTPGYRARDLADFARIYDRAGSLRATRPGHLGAPAGSAAAEALALRHALAEAPNGNAVSLELEMVRAAEVRQQHDMALAIQRAAAGILRSALGRGQ
jgi:flagellar basal-body rod protein FlgB